MLRVTLALVLFGAFGASSVIAATSSVAARGQEQVWVQQSSKVGPAWRGLLVMPRGKAPATGWPLIVALHGCNMTPDSLNQGTRLGERATAMGMAVLFPEQPAAANPVQCWNWFVPANQARQGEPAAIMSLLDLAAQRHPLQRGRIAVTGISAGAAMSWTLSVCYADRVRASLLHSGVGFAFARNGQAATQVLAKGRQVESAVANDLAIACAPRHPVSPSIVIQGESDDVVRPVNARQIVGQFQALSRHRGGDNKVRLIMVPGLGHAWSGGDPAVPYHAKGSPDATGLALELFRARLRQP